MLRPRVVGEGMGRGDGESIIATQMTSRHTNVSETNQCPAFVVYRTVEVRMHHILQGAFVRPPSRPYGCGKQMKTKGKRLEGMVFTNADPRYAGKLDDPQGGDATMLMQQVREVMTVNQEMTDESSWIWLTSEQMGVPLRSEFANENHDEA